MDIVDRLRANNCPENMGCGVTPKCACADMTDAAYEIERLRAALESIANHDPVREGQTPIGAIAAMARTAHKALK